MKPITNILLLLALVCYVFLPLFEISHLGSVSGHEFTSSMINYEQGFKSTLFALTPFIIIFLAIGFNCLKNRWWGIVDVLLIFLTLYFFFNLLAKFQGFSINHDPAVMANTEMSEGMPINGLGVGYYASAALTILAFLSALVSLMPFKFNKKIEETIDNRLESSKKRISKVGHGINDELHKIGKHSKSKNENVLPEAPVDVPPVPEDKEDESRFMPQDSKEDEQNRDYMPK